LFYSSQEPVAALEFAAGMLQQGDSPGIAATLGIDYFEERGELGFFGERKSQSR
jgi:hypothetical protein